MCVQDETSENTRAVKNNQITVYHVTHCSSHLKYAPPGSGSVSSGSGSLPFFGILGGGGECPAAAPLALSLPLPRLQQRLQRELFQPP